MTTKISEHITYHEATFSETALKHNIDNTPSETELNAMKVTANACFEPARRAAGHPIAINSFYRNRAVCLAINPKATYRSEHEFGFAMDLNSARYAAHRPDGMTNAHLFTWLSQNTEYNQLIWEYGDDNEPAWVHISHNPGNNKMGLFIKRSGQKMKKFDLDLEALKKKYLK